MILVVSAFLGVSLAANVVLVLTVLGLRGSIRAQSEVVKYLAAKLDTTHDLAVSTNGLVSGMRDQLPRKRSRAKAGGVS